jgi:hypothetical protein
MRHPIRAAQLAEAVERPAGAVQTPAPATIAHRTEDSLCVGMTRAPGMTPRISPVGMRNNLSPEKPTTSASICLPSAVSTRQRPPTAASQPTASSVMPTMRLSVPSTTIPTHCHALARLNQRFDPFLGRGSRQARSCRSASRRVRACASVPSSSLKMLPRRVSSRASMREVAVVIWQPPRAITGSSIMVQARSLSVGARLSRTTAASSGCRCTRTSRPPPAARRSLRG